MSEKRIFYGLDIFKLVCAFLIVFLHTYNRDGGEIGRWFHQVIASIGVPFFFIVSGFFFGKGINRSKLSIDYFKKYFLRLLLMYAAWTIITLPVSWLCVVRGHPDYSLGLKIVYLIRMILFSGSCGIYWYILALLCGSAIIYFFIKRKWEKYLYVIAFTGFVIGVWYDSPFNNHNLLYQGIHTIFGSERNFLNVGLFYMCIGYLFSTIKLQIKPIYPAIGFLCFCVFRSLEINTLHTNSLQAVLAVLLFLFSLNVNLIISDDKSITLRKLSTAMYLVHYPFILLFDFYLRRGTLTDYTITFCFCLLVFWMIMNLLPQKWQKVLIG